MSNETPPLREPEAIVFHPGWEKRFAAATPPAHNESAATRQVTQALLGDYARLRQLEERLKALVAEYPKTSSLVSRSRLDEVLKG